MEQKIVSFPKAKERRGPKSDQEHAKAIKSAQRKLSNAIYAATQAGLSVELVFDASDTVGCAPRCRDPKITRTF